MDFTAAHIADLAQNGFVKVANLWGPELAYNLREQFDDRDLFHIGVNMAKFNYGRGYYKYYRRSALPDVMIVLREQLYDAALPLARAWAPVMGLKYGFPNTYDEFDAFCCEAGQAESACLSLRYPEGGFNELHQDDKYGPEEVIFPFQLVGMLTPREEYDGGDFLLEETGTDGQKKLTKLQMDLGEGVVISTRYRVAGNSRLKLKHGVAEITRGRRSTAGIIVHNHQGPKPRKASPA